MLLGLYPREFRERFGSEMEQNFADLDREPENEKAKWMRTAWLFCDVLVQAVRENIVQSRRRLYMKRFLSGSRFAAGIGVLTILPGALLMLLLFLGIEPPLGPLRDPLAAPPDGSTVLGIGSFVALGFIVVLPVIGIVVIGAVGKVGNPVYDIGVGAAIGTLAVLPFIALQMTLGRASYSQFPVPLFALLWLLPALFAVVAAPTVRAARGGESVLAKPGLLVSRVLFLVLIGIFWAGLVTDQMPCFVGMPNCD